MEASLTPEEIRKDYGHLPYITPYRRIYALVDPEEDVVELHEFHARGKCNGGAAWEVYHYGRTSPLVREARREGARNIFRCETGRAELELVPGISGAGLEEVRVEGDRVGVTYAGLGGGGVAATLCRGMAENVLETEVHSRGGGSALGRATLWLPASRKLVAGADDTDDSQKGATWSTMNELAAELEEKGACAYLDHTIVQLFAGNPYRTTNCCSTAVTLVPREGVAEGELREQLVGLLGECCYSGECGAAFYGRIGVPDALRDFTEEARTGMVTEDRALDRARDCGVELVEVTGGRGRIGALAAVGAHDRPDRAVVPAAAGERGGRWTT